MRVKEKTDMLVSEDFGENEMGVGHRTDDDFEGEETFEDSREEDSYETE